MEIGIVGLGKMGLNLALNMQGNGYDVKGYDISSDLVKEASDKGIKGFENLSEMLSDFEGKKIIWVMVPCGKPTDSVLNKLISELKIDDIVIEGGNSNYKDSMRRADSFIEKGIHYFDCGTSGGTSGARNGGCFMIGGDKDVFEEIKPIFEDISVQDGYMYTGGSGSGHFLKMVHNGIEYGMMQAIGEGFQILEESDFDYNLKSAAKVFNNGSVIRSWLMELTENAFSKSSNLEEFRGVADASGEAKWTVETALEYEVAAPVIALSLMMRNFSKNEDNFSLKLVSALRNEFGGHSVKKK